MENTAQLATVEALRPGGEPGGWTLQERILLLEHKQYVSWKEVQNLGIMIFGLHKNKNFDMKTRDEKMLSTTASAFRIPIP